MLAVDCGNTRIKWAQYEAGRRTGEASASLRGDTDPFAVLSNALSGVKDRIDRVCVANVAGRQVAERVAVTVTSSLGIRPEFISVQPKAYGIECAYRDPQTLGVDRWLAMIAARRLAEGPFAVVCAGTAVTFDAVDAGGRHLGGLILPSERLMIEAMAANTDQIPVVERASGTVAGLDLLGSSTPEAVSHGARLAVAAAIDRAAETVNEALGEAVPLVVTGGDGPALTEWLASDTEVKADLVLDGLAAIADQGE